MGNINNAPTGKILGKVTLVDCVKMSPEFKDILLKENKDIYIQIVLLKKIMVGS